MIVLEAERLLRLAKRQRDQAARLLAEARRGLREGEVMKAVIARSESEIGWLEARRQGVTASDIQRMLTPSGRRRVIVEKLSGERANLQGVTAIRWGKARERAVMEWVESKFGIPPSDVLYAGENPRHLATPDGLLVEGGMPVAGCEVKCSARPMDLAEYMRQIQWQMHVTGLDKWLLVWEMNDGERPVPNPVGVPAFAWVERSDDFIAELVREADDLWAEAESAREGSPLVEDAGEIAALAADVLDARAIETEYRERKEAAWTKLKAALQGRGDGSLNLGGALVTWSTEARQTSVVDSEAMEAEAPEVVKAYEDLKSKHTTTKTGEPQIRLTVTERSRDGH